jgi:hypothetical protein
MTRKHRLMLEALQARAGCKFSSVELTGGGHLRITLPNGRRVITGSTPSDNRAFLNCVAQIKRTLRSSDVVSA